MLSLPPVYLHPSPLRTLVPHLRQHLPFSLPLLRRIQTHHTTPNACVFATVAPYTFSKTSDPVIFAATSVDTSRAPETECWLYSTHEHDRQPGVLRLLPHAQDGPDEALLIRRDAEAARYHILALMHQIANLPNAKPLLVIGTLNEALIPLLADTDLAHVRSQKVLPRTIEQVRAAGEAEHRQGILAGTSISYQKWLGDPRRFSADIELPEGYSFSTVASDEVGLCMSRSDIPRREGTLRGPASAAVRYGKELVAWIFLGVDGSLINLYVEPGHRKLGLAQAVSRRLIVRMAEDLVGMGFEAYGGAKGKYDAWLGHDIGVENLDSTGVAKALEGWNGWKVRWVTVDLGAVEKKVERQFGGGIEWKRRKNTSGMSKL